MNDIVSFEKILAYKKLKPFLSREDWTQLGEKLKIDKESLKRAWGKTVEDSFFLIALSYEVVDNIIVFDEAISKLGVTPSPDGLVLLKSGENLLVEVKAKTKDSIWTISKGRLERQKLLAQKIGIKLFYAINLLGYWGLYNSDFIENNSYQIEHPANLKASLFNETFNSDLIRIPKGLKIVKCYSLTTESSLISGFEPGYGYGVSYSVIFGNKRIEFDNPLQVVAFTAIEASFIMNVTKRKLTEDIHEITIECLQDQFIYDFNFILDPINATVSDMNKQRFDSSSFISHALHESLTKGEINFIQAKKNAYELINSLQGHGFPITISRASDIKDLEYLS